MKTKLLFLALFAVGISMTYAQNSKYEYNLSVVVEKNSGTTTANLDEGTIELTFDNVTIVPKTGSNTVIPFKDVKKVSFTEVKNGNYTSIDGVEVPAFKAYVPQGSNTLVIESAQPIGQIMIASVSGQIMVKTSSGDAVANVDVSALPKGYYILKAGNNVLKLYRW